VQKGKGLPGDKLSEMRGMDADQMLSLLIESRVVAQARPWRMADLVGDFNYLGNIQQHAERKVRRRRRWLPAAAAAARRRCRALTTTPAAALRRRGAHAFMVHVVIHQRAVVVCVTISLTLQLLLMRHAATTRALPASGGQLGAPGPQHGPAAAAHHRVRHPAHGKPWYPLRPQARDTGAALTF
jgi:hypothetical protein